MSDYTRLYDFSAKDALSSGDPNKLIKGSEVDDEFDSLVTHVATKFDTGDISTQTQAEEETLNTVILTPLRLANWADFNAGMVGDIQALTDPGADRILGWDDTAGAAIGFALSTGLTTSGTNLLIDTSVVPQLGESNTFAGAITFSSTVALNGTTTIAASFLPDADSTRAIGSTGTRFSDVFTDELNDIAVTDFARLSQNNTFTGITQTITAAGGSTAKLVVAGNGGTPGTNSFEFIHASDSIGYIIQRGNFGIDFYTNNTSRFTLSGDGNYNFKGGTVTTNNASPNEVGYKGAPLNAQSDNYTAVLTDAGKLLRQQVAAKTFTIPANASVAFPVGTIIGFQGYAVATTIAITSDTLYLAGTSTTGSRTLAAWGIATATKVGATEWVISGAGLS